MDIFDELIELSQLSGRIDTRCRLSNSWELHHKENQELAMVHIVIKGKSILRFPNEELTLKAGDLVFFPRVEKHTLCSLQAGERLPIQTREENGLHLKSVNNEPEDVEILCAHFSYAKNDLLLSNMPERLFLSLAQYTLAPMWAMLNAEMRAQQTANISAINAISKLLIIHILREYLKGESGGIFAASRDKRLKSLLKDMLAEPHLDWSLPVMAKKANLSRAQLIRLFQQILGSTPHNFLQKIRLSKAALLLKTTSDNVLLIALNCGFLSETHFGKVFKKNYGLTPKNYRKSVQKEELN